MPLIFPTSTRPLVLRPTYSVTRRRGISGIATSGAENALHIVRHNSASRRFPHIVTQKSGSRSLLPSVAQKSGSTNLLTMRPFSECSAGPVLARQRDSNRAGKSPFKDGIRGAELRWRMAPASPHVIVGRIFKVPIAPQEQTWMWASNHNGHMRRAAHGYEPTREAVMAAF